MLARKMASLLHFLMSLSALITFDTLAAGSVDTPATARLASLLLLLLLLLFFLPSASPPCALLALPFPFLFVASIAGLSVVSNPSGDHTSAASVQLLGESGGAREQDSLHCP